MNDKTMTIISQFDFKGELLKVEPFGSGHINDTFRLTYDDHGNISYYILDNLLIKNTHLVKKLNMCYYIFRVGEYMRPIKKAIRTFTDMDKVLFFISLILIIFGSLNIVTASSREAVVNADANMFYYFFIDVINVIFK